MTPVVWLSYDGDDPSGKWDAGLLHGLFGRVWHHPPKAREFTHTHTLPTSGGAVVVVAGGVNAHEVARLNRDLDPLDWVLLIVTADEQGLFPVDRVEHRNIEVWAQTRRRGDPAVCRRIPIGAPNHDRATAVDGRAGWVFAGQINHPRRRQMADRLEQRADGTLLPSAGFTQGVPRPEYLDLLAHAKVALAPSGPATPDTFRVWEAIEAGCTPLVDASCPTDPTAGWWDELVAGHPLPLVTDWADVDGHLDRELGDWPAPANRCRAWWHTLRRDLAHDLEQTLDRLGDPEAPATSVDDAVTVLIPTSPSPLHPDTGLIAETVGSVRDRLPRAEILIMVDGVHPDFDERRPAYTEYVRRLLELCAGWWNVTPLLHDVHMHQSGMTAAALDRVRTPLVLFVEHDTPLVGDIPFDGLAHLIGEGDADMVRLHHSTAIGDYHQHLMLDRSPRWVRGVPVVRTVQWSQRPHLASTAYYRDILAAHFTAGSRMMIEEVMCSVCSVAWRTDGVHGWHRHRVVIYAPSGDMQRSGHSDARRDDPVVPMTR